LSRSGNDKDLAGTQAAMIRATRRALHEARIHGVPVAQWRDGKVVWVHPDEIKLPPESSGGDDPQIQ